MRILHTSDWHLGRTLHGIDLTDAHARFLDHLVDVARQEQVDAVLVSGDVFDRALPPLSAVQLLDDGLARLCAIAPVVMTPGNHDAAARLGLNARLMRDQLHICSTLEGISTPVEIPDRTGAAGLLVYALPYLDPDMTRLELGELAGLEQPPARSHQAVMSTALSLVARDLSARRSASKSGTSADDRVPVVIIAHAFVNGSQPSDSERDLRIGGVDSVSAQLFADSGADYVALGHLHGPQVVNVPASAAAQPLVSTSENPPISAPSHPPVMRYAGSPLAFSFSEKNHRKSTALVDFDRTGAVSSVSLIDCPVPRRLSDVSGTLDKVLGPRFISQRDDWVRVTVTGADRPQDLTLTIKKAFPHAIEVRFESTTIAQRLAGSQTETVDPRDVLSDFVTQVGGRPPTDAELSVLDRVLTMANRQENR